MGDAHWYLFFMFLNAASEANDAYPNFDSKGEVYEDEGHGVEKSSLDAVGNKNDDLSDRIDVNDTWCQREYNEIDYGDYPEDDDEEYDEEVEDYWGYDDYDGYKLITQQPPNSSDINDQSSTFTVSLQNLFSEHQCSGILLSEMNVLTTCSCLMSYDKATGKYFELKPEIVQWSAVVGYGINKQTRFASNFQVHPNCRHIFGRFFANDLALVIVEFRFGIRNGETEIAPFYTLSVNIAKVEWNLFTKRNESCSVVGFSASESVLNKSLTSLVVRELQLSREISCSDFLDGKGKGDDSPSDDKISCFFAPFLGDSEWLRGANLQCGDKFFGLLGGIGKSQKSSEGGLVISITGLETILPFVLHPANVTTNITQGRSNGFKSRTPRRLGLALFMAVGLIPFFFTGIDFV